MICAFCDHPVGGSNGTALVRTGTDRAVCLTCFTVLLDAAESLLAGEMEYQSWARDADQA